MKKSNSKQKALGAVKKLGAVALITATIFFTACNQTGGGGNTGGGGGGSVVKDGAVLTLSPDKLNINVGAKTEDGSDIAVEGCEETTLESGKYKELHAKGTTVILKGKIVGFNCSENKLTALNVQGLTALKELECYNNQLTELNVQGCTSLQKLECRVNKLPELNVSGLTALNFVSCYYNQLNAQAMTKLLNALPAREKNDVAKAILYAEETGKTEEGNCKDYTQPAELKKALEDAKSRNWTLAKFNTSENSWVEI